MSLDLHTKDICSEPLPGTNLFCHLPFGHSGDHKVMVDEYGHPKRSATVRAVAAKATFPKFDRSNMFLFDPEKPKEEPNELLNRVHKGQMLDPHSMNHNCPFCNKTMAWDLFVAHAEDCFRKWRKVAYRKHRTIGTAIGEKHD